MFNDWFNWRWGCFSVNKQEFPYWSSFTTRRDYVGLILPPVRDHRGTRILSQIYKYFTNYFHKNMNLHKRFQLNFTWSWALIQYSDSQEKRVSTKNLTPAPITVAGRVIPWGRVGRRSIQVRTFSEKASTDCKLYWADREKFMLWWRSVNHSPVMRWSKVTVMARERISACISPNILLAKCWRDFESCC